MQEKFPTRFPKFFDPGSVVQMCKLQQHGPHLLRRFPPQQCFLSSIIPAKQLQRRVFNLSRVENLFWPPSCRTSSTYPNTHSLAQLNSKRIFAPRVVITEGRYLMICGGQQLHMNTMFIQSLR